MQCEKTKKLMKKESVLVSSIIKDAELWIKPFLRNIRALNDSDNLNLDYLFIEGNSDDETYPILSRWRDNCKLNVTLVKHDLPEEMATIDRVMASIELIADIQNYLATDTDYIMLIDADIVEMPSNMLTILTENMKSHSADIIAPHVLIAGTDKFYDTHVFRMNKKNFVRTAPYAPDNKTHATPFEVDSVGTCLLFKSDVFMDVIVENRKYRKACRKENVDGYLCICSTAKRIGYRILADPTVRIAHVNFTKYNKSWHSTNYWLT